MVEDLRNEKGKEEMDRYQCDAYEEAVDFDQNGVDQFNYYGSAEVAIRQYQGLEGRLDWTAKYRARGLEKDDV